MCIRKKIHDINPNISDKVCNTPNLAADVVHTLNPLLSKEVCINGDGRIFDFREINEGDMHQAVSRIKVKKSFGNDNISGYFLKIAFPYISRIDSLRGILVNKLTTSK